MVKVESLRAIREDITQQCQFFSIGFAISDYGLTIWCKHWLGKTGWN